MKIVLTYRISKWLVGKLVDTIYYLMFKLRLKREQIW